MRSASIITWTRPRVSSLIWLVTLFVFVGQARLARATCGDYLSTSKHVIDFVTDQSSATHEMLPPATKVPACTGPGCQPYRPRPHQPVSMTMALEAILLPPPQLIRPAIESLRRWDSIIPIPGPADRIFRPPRTASA